MTQVQVRLRLTHAHTNSHHVRARALQGAKDEAAPCGAGSHPQDRRGSSGRAAVPPVRRVPRSLLRDWARGHSLDIVWGYDLTRQSSASSFWTGTRG